MHTSGGDVYNIPLDGNGSSATQTQSTFKRTPVLSQHAFPRRQRTLALNLVGSEQSVVESLQAYHAFRDAAANELLSMNAPLERTPAAFGRTVASTQWACGVCGVAFQREDAYKRHMEAAHRG
ncbi:uncharacterized protein B0H18DRAFT_70273 [Fomitopsis serialis]|uniref:uncharacterized protein n=1 Tax=Fomitopsis serialis TaxID=139415 RepID=UPI0020076D41|nr:uncharacterized protein B0H18DRAFT_70273 [Neoantrodia serialis]KAH9931919.1 hypothetical protein B0H18DRAFT_70273 [Neoantrodia serialis]